MMKLPFLGLSLAALGLLTACGSSDTDTKETAQSECETRDGFLCAPDDLKGFPFVSFAVSYSVEALCSQGTCTAGETTVTMSQPEEGRLCLAGRVAPDELLAGVNLALAPRNREGTEVFEPFDAAARHITQVGLTLDTPPPAGVHLSLSTVAQLECPEDPLDCDYAYDFGQLGAGPVIVPFADFISAADPSVPVDTSLLNELFFQVGPGDYDFCIRDLHWLDADDHPVNP